MPGDRGLGCSSCWFRVLFLFTGFFVLACRWLIPFRYVCGVRGGWFIPLGSLGG